MIDDKLVVRSSMTTRQLQIVKSHQLVRHNKISAEDATQIDTSRRISIGAYYRILSQAKSNLEQSIFTILIGVRLGLIKREDFERLLDLMERVPREVNEQSSEELIVLIELLMKKIVML